MATILLYRIAISIIESDNKPFKILPPPEDDDNPLENSCTLNNEC